LTTLNLFYDHQITNLTYFNRICILPDDPSNDLNRLKNFFKKHDFEIIEFNSIENLYYLLEKQNIKTTDLFANNKKYLLIPHSLKIVPDLIKERFLLIQNMDLKLFQNNLSNISN